MKTVTTILLLLTIAFTGYGQDKGIQFHHGSFREILEEAKKENKLIFIDSYTSWCAPCKWMEQHIFPLQEVGDYYNKHFINFKIDMEKGEGPELAKKYAVKSYPTYLFLDHTGNLVHKATSRMEAEAFIAEGAKATDPALGFTALKERYQSGDLTFEVLLHYALDLNKMRDPLAPEVIAKLLDHVTDEQLLTMDGFKVIDNFAQGEDSDLYQFFLANKEHFIHQNGEEATYKVIQKNMNRTLYSAIHKQDANLFFAKLKELKKLPLPEIEADAAMLEISYYIRGQQADKFIQRSDIFANGVLKNDDQRLSFIARSCENSNSDRNMLLQAAKLAKQAVAINPEEYSNQGTYATINYKLGNKKEALTAAKEASRIADGITSKIKGIAESLVAKIEAMPD